MKEIHSNIELKELIQTRETVWLLLFKSGLEHSECARKGYAEAVSKTVSQDFFISDVASVRDIHPEYGIQTVPSLLEFRFGKLVNVFKVAINLRNSDQFLKMLYL